jgi:3-oxoadipate enol-lactonase
MSRKQFQIVERGAGAPLVLIPGIQGRWEYSRALVDALAPFCRVITFSLGDERVSGAVPQIDVFADQAARAIDRLGIERAAVAGVSFGGLVALRFAATRADRTSALVMLSAPGPQWRLRPRHEWYSRLPWVFGPVFLAEAPFRLRQEVMAALPEWPARLRYLSAQLKTFASARVSVSRMAARARLITSYDRVADCARVTAPSLIVQGDESLDHVTGSGGTAEYARLIRGARLVRMPHTGHLGSVTQPERCADLIRRFLVDTIKDTHHSAA